MAKRDDVDGPFARLIWQPEQSTAVRFGGEERKQLTDIQFGGPEGTAVQLSDSADGTETCMGHGISSVMVWHLARRKERKTGRYSHATDGHIAPPSLKTS